MHSLRLKAMGGRNAALYVQVGNSKVTVNFKLSQIARGLQAQTLTQSQYREKERIALR